MATKMTKKDYFTQLKNVPEVASNKAFVAFIDHELDLLTRKNSGERKLTKTQSANVELKDALYADMEANRAYTVTELTKSAPSVCGLTGQKVSALLRQMIKDGRVTRNEVKRIAYFTAVK